MFKRGAARNFYNISYTPTLDIIGGETLLYTDLADYALELYCSKLKEHHLNSDKKVIMSTNGTLISESTDIQNFLKKWKHIVGLSMSIDGTKESHDKYRLDANGNGTWDRAVEGAKWVMANLPDMKINARLTATKENIGSLSDGVIGLYELGFTNVGMRAAVGFDYWEDDEDTINYVYSCFKPISDYLLEHPNNRFAPYHLYYANAHNMNGKNQGCNCGDDRYVTLGVDGLVYHCMRMATCEKSKFPFAMIDKETDEFVVLPNNPTEMLTGCWKYCPEKCHTCPISSVCGLCVAAVVEYNQEDLSAYHKQYSTCGYNKGLSLAGKDYFERKILLESNNLNT
jgi:uncharacterized protein